jgi:ferredoxin--NADP+ reductase
VIGSGPSGFYAAGQLLDAEELEAHVDVYDRLPTPWGLVRAGVAPDHPNIKAVSRVYEKIAARPGFRFFGNVEFGRHISRAELLQHYHAVIYAVGAQTDKRMGIPGEDLPGSWPATDFVAWYNGHPDCSHLEFNLSCERAVVIGNGNVAADVARMLALTPAELAQTDIADYALEALSASTIREIVVLGRRGAAQAAFTNPELVEFGELADADVSADPSVLELDPLNQTWLENEGGPTASRNVETLRQYASRRPGAKSRRVIFRFLVSPIELSGDGRVEAITVCRNRLVQRNALLAAEPTEERETCPAGLVLRSIGYRGVALPGVPFDTSRCVIPNERGRVVDPDLREQPQGEYAVGWIKRGPTGIIGTNKKDAQETVSSLVEDVRSGRLPVPVTSDPGALERLLRRRTTDLVTYEGWEAIDRLEREHGERQGRPRAKYCTYEGLLEAAAIPTALPS